MQNSISMGSKDKDVRSLPEELSLIQLMTYSCYYPNYIIIKNPLKNKSQLNPHTYIYL